MRQGHHHLPCNGRVKKKYGNIHKEDVKHIPHFLFIYFFKGVFKMLLSYLFLKIYILYFRGEGVSKSVKISILFPFTFLNPADTF